MRALLVVLIGLRMVLLLVLVLLLLLLLLLTADMPSSRFDFKI